MQCQFMLNSAQTEITGSDSVSVTVSCRQWQATIVANTLTHNSYGSVNITKNKHRYKYRSDSCQSHLQWNMTRYSIHYNRDRTINIKNEIKYTHTHTHWTALFPGLPRWAGTRKVKPIWILLKQQTVSGSDISWAICKSAPHSRQITMPAPHDSVFIVQMPFLLPNQQSKHWRHHEIK